MSEFALAAFIAVAIPFGIQYLLWRHARRQLPDFRIQYSIFDLWMLALCSSPAFIIATVRFEHVPISETVCLFALMILHQTTGAFFMYVLERLTPESIRASPMPLVILAGSLLGWTIFPLLTFVVIFVVYWMLGF